MGLFGNIFSAKPAVADPDFVNPITTDLHCHLIPGIDDGVQTLQESIDILSALSAMGYKKVITTPHIMGDFYKNGPENILPGLETVRAAIREKGLDIALDAAAEYLVDDALEQKVEKKELLTFGKNYVLIELPFTEEPANLKSVLFNMRVNGYKPVLAHPERYAFFAANKEKYRELFDSGILFQLNLYSLVGYYSAQIQKTAEWLLENKMVNMVGSDTHGMRHLPVFDAATHSRNYQKLCGLNLLNNQL